METIRQSKLIKVLKDIENALAKQGHFDFKKRFVNIYKTILSMEKHENCYVSDFCETYGVKHPSDYNTSSNHNSDNEDNGDSYDKKDQIKKEVASKYQSETNQMDSLLGFIEGQLSLKNLTLNDTSTDDENSKQSNEREKLDSKILAIEKRVRGYLKEYRKRDIYKSNNFDSYIDDPRLRTPLSKIPFSKCETPVISKNFFTEINEATIENARRRHSKREELVPSLLKFLELQSGENRNTCYSNVDKFKEVNLRNLKKMEEQNEIKDFSDEDFSPKRTDSGTAKFTMNKRGSIFKDMKVTVNIKEEEESGGSSSENEDDDSQN